MKYLRIIATMNPNSGGPCQGIRNMVPVQQRAGIENEVLCFDSPGSDFLEGANFKIHAIGPAFGPYAYCSNLNMWLSDNIHRFDVLIIHGLWLYNSFGTYLKWKKLKENKNHIPQLFVMPHGMLDPYFQRAKSRKLKAIRNWFFWHLVEKQVVNGVDGLLFTCERELELAKEAFNQYHPRKELNVGYGIPEPPEIKPEATDAFFRKCAGLSRKPFWLFLSRIHPKKGVDILIEAYSKLRKEYPYLPEMVIAGPGLNSKFGMKIYEIGRKEGIYFPGMLRGSEKWAAFKECEAFILPSHQENFGIAIVEAMACKKPVLITNKVNIWKEIEDVNAGIIAEDNLEAVFTMLQTWNKMSSEEKKEKSIKAYQLFKEKFSVENTAIRMAKKIESSRQVMINEKGSIVEVKA